jgi:uncharacterized protein
MLDQFSRQNRWWTDPSAIEGDRHLVRMREARVSWMPALPFRFEHDAIYTLRGPRQVGKSTVLKRQIRDLIAAGWPTRQILYLDVELAGLERGADLVAALRTYLDGERSQAGQAQARCAIFLDEVTRIDNWAGAIRGLVDNDELRNVTLVATGSHTRDVRAGGERLPSRRGGIELDWELLPLSFREFVALVAPHLRLPPVLLALSLEDARASRRAMELLRPQISALFERYLAVGGFMPAINDDAAYGAVRAETFQIYREAITGEFTRAGLRESYLREVINWLADHLGQEFDYRDVAADTDIGSKDTARNYVDNLEASYAASVCYRTPDLSNPSPAFRGPKKIHPMDPLVWHLIRAWAAADPDPWQASVAALGSPEIVGHLVESVLVVHARRAFGARVYYWHPDKRREIDLVVASAGANVALLESKYRQRVDDQEVRSLVSSGGGLVVTKQTEGDLAGGSVYSLPASDFLAIIDAPSIVPCR